MPSVTVGRPLLADVEDALANSRPFGNHRYIAKRIWTHYERRLEMLAHDLPFSNKLLEALRRTSPRIRDRVIREPVLRCAINSALCHFKLHGPSSFLVDELDYVFALAQKQCRATNRRNARPAKYRHTFIGQLRCRSAIWSGENDDDGFAKLFRRVFHLYHPGLDLCVPGSHCLNTLELGSELLDMLMPMLGRSALAHVGRLGIVQVPKTASFSSVTNPGVPGAFFLSPAVLRTPWQAAEYLLHESLHVKFVDIEHTHSLLSQKYEVTKSPKIRPHWNRIEPNLTNEWPISRSLTVCHVYACLAIFFSRVHMLGPKLVERFGPFHGLDPVLSARRSFDRAQYLASRIKEHGDQLGAAGILFVNWLSNIITASDSNPVPEGVYVHLLLDLYDREARDLRPFMEVLEKKRASGANSVEHVHENLANMIRNELSNTRSVLSTLGESALPGLLKELLTTIQADDETSTIELLSNLLNARALISRGLRAIPPAEFVGNGHTDVERSPQGLVRAMVERSGQELNTLIKYLKA